MTAEALPAGVLLLPAIGHRRYRWRNGLGAAAEIAAGPRPPTDVAGWTLSIATVASDVAFSSFPGMHRKLMALSPGGLGLVLDGRARSLAQWEVAAFAGEDAVSSVGVAGPTLDLNLMIERRRFAGSLATVSVDGATAIAAPAGSTTVLVHLGGIVEAEGRALAAHDAVRVDAGATCRLAGDGILALVRIAEQRGGAARIVGA